MPALQQTGNSLHVDHFRAHYLIASDHPAPKTVKHRLDDALSKALPDSLRVALSSWLSDDDPSIWFVRELNVNLDLNLDWNPDQVGKTWATQLVRKLSRDLKEDNAHGVIRFRNRGAYLATFLRDLAAGDAWTRWYYKPFEGLRMVPLSAAISTAIRNDIGTSLFALLQLSARDLTKVIECLSTQETRNVLEAIAETRPSLDDEQCFANLWKVWKTDELEFLQTSNESSLELRLYLEIERRKSGGGATLQRAAVAFVRLFESLKLGSLNQEALRALLAGDIAGLYIAAGAQDAEVLLPFTHCPPELLQEIWSTISATTDCVRYERDASQKEYTSFGGVFILLPLLDRLPLTTLTDGWPNVIDQQSAASLVRFIVLIKCLGNGRFESAWNDPLLRDLLRIVPQISVDTINDWSAQIPLRLVEGFIQQLALWDRENRPVEQSLLLVTKLNDDVEYLKSSILRSTAFDLAMSIAAQRVMRQLSWRLPGFSQSSLPYLYANFLDFRAGVEAEPDRYVVRVGTPPLNIILAITGLQRTSFNLSWLEDQRPFKLFQTE
jgi:hypothetical protein